MKQQDTFLIAERFITLYDLMDKEIMKAFEDLYAAHLKLGGLGLESIDLERFRKSSFKFFDICKKKRKREKFDLHDMFFNNLIELWHDYIFSKGIKKAKWVWEFALELAHDWEKKNNKKIHKGTPYYFFAVASILLNDFDAALMSMHNALDEDKKNAPNLTKLPAYYFLTLNDQKTDQYFKPFVDEIIGFIRYYLDGKGGELNGELTYSQFRNKFLKNRGVSKDVKFFFVYSIIRLWHLHKLHKNKLGDNLMAPLIFTNSLFNLILVVDDLLKTWNNPNLERKLFSHHLPKIAINENWINSQYEDQYIGDLNYNNRRNSDFNNWCEELIGFRGKTYITENSRRVLGELESDFVLTCGLRNFSAHTVKSHWFLWEHYSDILQSVLNCLFRTIELL